MSTYFPIASSEESTVVTTFEAPERQATSYQSEAQLEAALIAQLQRQEYEYLDVKDVNGLKANLRVQLERLNEISLSDGEWQRFCDQHLMNRSLGIPQKTAIIQANPAALSFQRDDGSHKNIHLLDKTNIHRNHLQVINQYEADGTYHNRYDVTLLVNGLPLVHIELKRRGVELREAFNQINRYQRDSFWTDSGLFEYVQVFVISNGTFTKYYANTTRAGHLKEQASPKLRGAAASFEFTSWWTDAANRRITDLLDFAKTFLAKRTVLNVITRYCVFTVDQNLMVMRPYQIVAAERIINRIRLATNYRKTGTIEAGGYIWHTTGSGKTLTSFKTAQLACGIDGVDKVLFVVDRKDLDYQTKREYEKFQKGAVNSNKSTAELAKQLGNPAAKIVITTIQKLSNFVHANKGHAVFDAHVVIIFDECHRSQFGDMHRDIKRAFRNYHLFGFTGTPIFNENKGAGGTPIRTTAQVFGDRLHAYTITDAITDGNVLRFRLEYYRTVKAREGIEDKKVSSIATEEALLDPRRISQVVGYILEHFDQKTKRNSHYALEGKRVRGFNSIFATASVKAARAYYTEFASQQAGLPVAQRLKIATIFTYAPNPDDYSDGLLPEEDFDASSLAGPDRDFLETAIADYNQIFGCNFDTTAGRFQNYYEDVSKRLRNRELDMLIVVNMFLTGFDAKTLNTLWVDKPLRHHGLLQAYSRTNRILNSVKTYGHIVTFRNLEVQTNEALALFGNKEAKGITILRPFAEYFQNYCQKLDCLRQWEPGQTPESEAEQDQFIKVFGELLRLRNILQSFDEFEAQDPLTPRDLQDYQSAYLELYRERRSQNATQPELINDDLVFEIELMKQVEVNVYYILMLVAKYRDQHQSSEQEEIRADIERTVKSSPTLQNKLDLIEHFLEVVSPRGEVDAQWRDFLATQKARELADLVASENLKPAETQAFVETMFRQGHLETGGTDIEGILPLRPLFGAGGEDRASLRARVTQKLQAFFDRFHML